MIHLHVAIPLMFALFGGGGKTPDVAAAPAVAPPPSATPTQPNQSIEGRQRQVAMLKYGSLATVANEGGAGGLTGGIEMYPTMTAGTSGKQTTGGQ